MLRFISVWLRKIQEKQDAKKGLILFEAWKKKIALLQPAVIKNNKTLIIRLDDIGDYILFRNSLEIYRNAWKTTQLTLLGNIAWKPLFDEMDAHNTNDALWIDKKIFSADENYRMQMLQRLRSEGFDTVVCPARTRQLLLDDICMLATNAQVSIATDNVHLHAEWCNVSDSFYSKIISIQKMQHEFF